MEVERKVPGKNQSVFFENSGVEDFTKFVFTGLIFFLKFCIAEKNVWVEVTLLVGHRVDLEIQSHGLILKDKVKIAVWS